MRQRVTRVYCRSRIDCDISFVNVPDDAVFIDHKRCAISKALLLVKDTIILNDCAFEIAEEWKGYSELLCEFAVGGNTVYTHSKNLGVG